MTRFAFLMPGQGAQAVGMGKAFYDRYETSKAVYKRANAKLNFDVTALCFEGPPEELTNTARCQVALFVTSMAAFSVFQELAPALRPVGVAGLSLGELTSLAAAHALTFDDGLYVVQARGEAMAVCAAHSKGAMLAVLGLSGEPLEAVCKESGATTANYNTAEQVVLSGTVAAIAKAEGLAKEKGAKRTIRLDVAGAFHSALMQPAAEQLKQVLAKVEIRPPVYPVISNVTAQPVLNPTQVRRLLVQQIVSPVLWEPSMRWLLKAGATHFLEFPPARVLTGLLRQIDASVTAIPLNDPADFDQLPP